MIPRRRPYVILDEIACERHKSVRDLHPRSLPEGVPAGPDRLKHIKKKCPKHVRFANNKKQFMCKSRVDWQ